MSSIIKSFNGKTIRVREDDQYFCLTDMAISVNKRYHDWARLDGTKEYLIALEGSTQIPVDRLISIKVDGPNEDRGTWAHKLVALEFARWCSPEFAIQCNI